MGEGEIQRLFKDICSVEHDAASRLNSETLKQLLQEADRQMPQFQYTYLR
jgi:hypothetical protein